MKKNILYSQIINVLLLMLLFTNSSYGQTTTTLKAGDKIDVSTLSQTEISTYFNSQEINNSILERINGKSYTPNDVISLEELVYITILHTNSSGETKLGELICNKKISDDILSIFRKLYEAKYPIEKMVLIDEYGADDNLSMIDNNSSCFNFRRKTSGSGYSKHSYGLAIDINPLYNPYVRKYSDGTVEISPKEGAQYSDRNKNHPYMIKWGDLCHKLFLQHGFMWGGRWRSVKDYQHFELNSTNF